MKKILAVAGICTIAIFALLALFLLPSAEYLLIDGFDGQIKGGIHPTVDYGSGAGAKIDVSGSRETVYYGKQSLKIVYDVSEGGYMWAARGYGLTAPGAAQWKKVPSKIVWDNYDTLVFYIYGEGIGNDIAVDIIDSNKQYWRCLVKDDAKGWQKIVLPFSSFGARTDWQPSDAVRDNTIRFPVNAFQFEPKTGAGTVYIDKVCLKRKAKK